MGGNIVHLLAIFIALHFIHSNAIPAIDTRPQAVKITADSVLLRFNAANESVSSYTIQYTREIQGIVLAYKSGENIVSQPGDETYNVLIDMLRPGTTYHIRVVPFEGIASPALRITTELLSLVSTPRSIVVTTSSVIVEFQAANSRVTRYRVEYGEEQRGMIVTFNKHMTIEEMSGQRTYMFSSTGLKTGVYYHYRVIPYVNGYRGKSSPVLKVWIPKPTIFVRPTISRIETTKATVSFRPTQLTTDRYYVQYKKAGLGDETIFENGVHVNEDGRSNNTQYVAIQGGLSPSTDYVFRVMPTVKSGSDYHEGTPSPEVNIRTAPGSETTNNYFKLEGCNILQAIVPVVSAVVGAMLIAFIFILCYRCRRHSGSPRDKKGAPSKGELQSTKDKRRISKQTSLVAVEDKGRERYEEKLPSPPEAPAKTKKRDIAEEQADYENASFFSEEEETHQYEDIGKKGLK